MNKKLYRSQKDKIIAGVCGGLAEYFEIDSTIIRLIFILLFAFGGSAVLVYILLWIVLPKSSQEPIALNQERIKEFASDIKEKAQDLKEEFRINQVAKETHRRRGHLFGWILMLLGIVFLANSFFPVWFGVSLFRFWPILLVLVGIVLIASGERR